MKADQTGTHSEQIRHRIGWRTATQTAFAGAKAKPCHTCRHWGGTPVAPRALCSLTGLATVRNASCDRHGGAGQTAA